MRLNEIITEATRCWKGYEKKGIKTHFGKRVPNCVKKESVNLNEDLPKNYNLDSETYKGTANRIPNSKSISKKDITVKGKQVDFPDGGYEATQFNNMLKKEMKKNIKDVLNTLTTIEQAVIKARFGIEPFGHEYTLKEIGNALGVGAERVRQIEAKALRKLKHPSRSEKVRSYLNQSVDYSNMSIEQIEEDLRAWFGKGKKGGAGGGGWDAYNSKGERIGKCGDTDGRAKPKCLSKSAAAKLRNADADGDGKRDGAAGIARAVKRKRAKDPNPNRRGAAKNVKN